MPDAFDPDAYLAAREQGADFDPDAYLKAKAPQTGMAKIGVAGLDDPAFRAGAIHFGNQGTLGFSDEIGGLLGALTGHGQGAKLGAGAQPAADDSPEVAQAKREALTEQAAQPSDYQLVRDRMRAELRAAKEEHPGASMLGDVAGSLASSYVLPGSGLKSAIATGAAAGLGNSDADLTTGDASNFGRAAVDTAVGGAMGAVGYGIGRGLQRGAGALAERLRRSAGVQAVRASGTMLKDVRQMGGVDRAIDWGNDLLREGAVPFGANVEGVAERVEPLRQEAGRRIGQALGALDQAAAAAPSVGGQAASLPLNGHAIADRIEQEVIAPLAQYSPNRGIVDALQRETDALRAAHGQPLTFAQAEGLKRSFDSLAHWERGMDPALRPQTEAFRQLQNVIRTEVERQAQAVSPGLAQAFENMKDAYGLFAPAARIAADKAARMQANRAFSPSSYGVGGAIAAGSEAAGQGSAVAALKGGVVAMIHKLILERGNSAAAVTLHHLASVMERDPEALGRFAQPILSAAARGSQALQVAHEVLLRNEPEYAATLEKESAP